PRHLDRTTRLAHAAVGPANSAAQQEFYKVPTKSMRQHLATGTVIRCIPAQNWATAGQPRLGTPRRSGRHRPRTTEDGPTWGGRAIGGAARRRGARVRGGPRAPRHRGSRPPPPSHVPLAYARLSPDAVLESAPLAPSPQGSQSGLLTGLQPGEGGLVHVRHKADRLSNGEPARLGHLAGTRGAHIRPLVWAVRHVGDGLPRCRRQGAS